MLECRATSAIASSIISTTIWTEPHSVPMNRNQFHLNFLNSKVIPAKKNMLAWIRWRGAMCHSQRIHWIEWNWLWILCKMSIHKRQYTTTLTSSGTSSHFVLFLFSVLVSLRISHLLNFAFYRFRCRCFFLRTPKHDSCTNSAFQFEVLICV